MAKRANICYNEGVRKIKTTRLSTVLLSIMALSAGPAIADENNNNSDVLPVFLTSAYQNEFDWRENAGDFRVPVEAEVPLETSANANISGTDIPEIQPEKTASFDDEEDFVDKIMDKVPYSKRLKSTWNFIDGETDIYVEGLRVDRGNMGLSYQTNTVPFVGEVEGLEIKAEMGEESKLKLKSSHVPFVGHVEGLEFKSSVGEEQAVSVRYTVSLDRLGL